MPKGQHTVENVYTEMFYQICLDYHTLPGVHEITLSEIEFFYKGIIPQLKEATRPK